jgi:hypothetical protein
MARRPTRSVIRFGEILLGEQCQQAFGHHSMAGGRPMRAIAIGMGLGSIEGDERNSLGLQMLNEFAVAALETDDQPGPAGFHEITHRADDSLGRIGNVEFRMPGFDISEYSQAGEPQMTYQPILADI